jgi:cobalt transporter subunit CbtB
MSTATDTVHGRIEHVRTWSTPGLLAIGVALLAVVGFTLLFVQEPAVHESLHDFRHAAGITCH